MIEEDVDKEQIRDLRQRLELLETQKKKDEAEFRAKLLQRKKAPLGLSDKLALIYAQAKETGRGGAEDSEHESGDEIHVCRAPGDREGRSRGGRSPAPAAQGPPRPLPGTRQCAGRSASAVGRSARGVRGPSTAVG